MTDFRVRPCRPPGREMEKTMSEMLLSERIMEDGIEITADEAGISDDGERAAWRVTLSRPDGRTFTLPDLFESNTEPTAFDVLDLVTLHASVVDQTRDWREWQGEFQFAEPGTSAWEKRDRTHTKETYKSWVQINKDLHAFLGPDGHHAYLYETDRSA